MRDYEKLRKGLVDLGAVTSAVFHAWEDDKGLPIPEVTMDYLRYWWKEAEHALAETSEDSEMERFKVRLWAVVYETDEDEHGVTWLSVPKTILADLWAEFGYGEE